MAILDKVKNNPNICSIELSFDGYIRPSVIALNQPFYDNNLVSGTFSKTAALISSLDFEEESTLTPSGYLYKQKISFRFLSTDNVRAQRIDQIHKLKFAKINLTSGKSLIVGRNDYYQNTAPIIKAKSNNKVCDIEIQMQSIFPSGYLD